MQNRCKFFLMVQALVLPFFLSANDTFLLNYEDVDIKKVTQDIAQFSKKTIILDPRVKGKITIYLLVDRGSNVDRIRSLIADLDQNNSARVTILKLENLSAVEAVRILDKLKAQNNPTINKFTAIPFSPTNSVIISASDFITNNISSTLNKLDADITSDDSVDVIYLKYAKATDISSILSSISGSFLDTADGKKTVITHHEKTNSLIVSSDEKNLFTIKNIISKLDIRRAQVLVEAIIVELSETAAKTLGVETIYTSDDKDGVPIGVTRFGGTGPDLLSIVGAASDDEDVNLNTTAISSLLNTQGLVTGFGDLSDGGDNFVGIINAIAQDSNSNILSTPSILAMDNETANLVIGQEIPFRTTSRQEVGIKLEVTPQINEGSSVILNIKQEVSGVAGVITSGIDLITNKRVIETTVLVDNGQIIVLGGLIDEDTQETISKIPLLGSIPVLGKLFQSSSSSVVQKNLMVFLRPTIILDSDESVQLSTDKYNYIKARQLLTGESKQVIDLTKPDN